MSKVMIACLLAMAAGQAYAVNCKQIERSEIEFPGDYFAEVQENNLADGEYKSKLLRKSVAAFHGDLDPALSEEEVDEMGEGVYFYLVRDPDGKTYQAVNVGFGGGNSATYYYRPNTLRMISIMSEDGDCIDMGTARTFPIERIITRTKNQKAVCTVNDGNSPFAKFVVSVNLTTSGTYFGAPVDVEPAEPVDVVENLVLDVPEKLTDLDPMIYQMNDAIKVSAGFVTTGDRLETKWTADVHLTLNGKNLKVTGRLYPNITGGYWSDDAREIKANGSCGRAIRVNKIRYHRVIKY